jgi:hypothetical protein
MVEIVVDPERQLARRQELRSVIADAISSI